MKYPLKKSPIPNSHALLIKKLDDPSFDPSWHFHPEYQLFSVIRGSGTRFIGDEIKPFRDGDLTLTGPNLPHLWQSQNSKEKASNSKGIVVYFTEETIGPELLQKEEAIKIKLLLTKCCRGLEVTGPLSNSIQNKLINLVSATGFSRVLGLLEILHVLSSAPDLTYISSPGYTNTLKFGDTKRMNKVYSYTMQHFRNKIRLSELADITNMTTTSFSRYFKTHANKTFSQFLCEIRIGHACKLLIEDSANASQACYGSGFQTLSNFNRQFKKITKRTPLAYRKEYELA